MNELHIGDGDIGWDATFEVDPSRRRVSYRVLRRVARATDGTLFWEGPGGMTEHREQATLMLHGQLRDDYPQDRNSDEFFIRVPGEPEIGSEEVELFTVMLIAVRDRCRELMPK